MSDSQKPPHIKRPSGTANDPDSWKDLSKNVAAVNPSPAGKVPMGRPAKILPSDPPTSPAKTRIRGLRIFIVDDDPIRVDALAMDLRNLGGSVAVGDRSGGGYKQAAKFLPDAIISDLVRPGETGFQFIESLRRHPLLRWSSVLLIRWWEQTTEGEGRVILDHVLNQLEELLAPIRIIEERITAKRPLGDRIDLTGPAALLRILSNAGLSGELSVVDAWNMFTVGLTNGLFLSAHRKGIDGESDYDLQAVLQLLLCDTGRWSFTRSKREPKTPVPLPDIEATLTRANNILSRLFGPGVRQGSDLYSHIAVRENFLRTAYETMPEAAMQVVKAISKGADLQHFRATLTTKRDIAEVERIIQTLFRCGAIRFSEEPIDGPSSEPAKKASTSAVNLLMALTEMSISAGALRRAPKEVMTSIADAAGQKKGLPRGAYHLQDVAPERIVVAKHRPVKLAMGGLDEDSGLRSMTTEPPDPIELCTTDMVVAETKIGKRPKKQRTSLEAAKDAADKDTGTEKFLLESQELELGHYPEHFNRHTGNDHRQMWLALALALFLGGLLAAGIAVIASSGREPHPLPTETAPE